MVRRSVVMKEAATIVALKMVNLSVIALIGLTRIIAVLVSATTSCNFKILNIR